MTKIGKKEVFGITSSQTEILGELSEDEFNELDRMTFSERRDYLDEVAFLIEKGTRERKKPKEPREDLEKTLKEERQRHWLEEEKARQGWRYQYDRAEKLAKEKEKIEKKREFEKKYGKGAVLLLGHPFRAKKVIHLDEEEEE